MEHQNLLQLLHHAATNFPSNGFKFYSPGSVDKTAEDVSYRDFLQTVSSKANLLRRFDLKPNSIVLLHFDSQKDSLEWFWAVNFAGHIPAMSTPLSNNAEQRLGHILYLHELLQDPLCLTTKASLDLFSGQQSLQVQAVETLTPAGTGHLTPPVEAETLRKPQDIAAMMLTSGSTGRAKAVCLTHGMILSAVAAKAAKNSTQGSETFFNWIGADHVACLTEIHLHAMYLGANQVHAHAADMVTSPLAFLGLLERHHVGYTFAPNFFLAALLRAVEETKQTRKFDLACLHSLISGGEANVVQTCKMLASHLEGMGTPQNCIKPAFGMTETCAGSIYNQDFPTHDIARAHEFASIGTTHAAMAMRIVDPDTGVEVTQGESGALEVKGGAVFSEYFRNPEATREAFHDGWFITGDQGRIDSGGQLQLTGRAKETLIINGINYSPQDIETVIESAQISGVRAAFSVVFPYRPKAAETESICVIYCPTYDQGDMANRYTCNDAIATAVMQHVGVRPYVLPLGSEASVMQKTTLGKLSRTKIKKAFEAGELDAFRERNEAQIAAYKLQIFEPAATKMEELVLNALAEATGYTVFDIGGVNADLYALGVNSLDIIRIKKALEGALHNGVVVPIITIISNPTARRLAAALEDMQRPREYDPVIVLQPKGDKTPLWLIHPGVGEVLVFLGLAGYITDRPVYALRARGFEQGEPFFSSIEDAVTTYHSHIKRVQPTGPYAIAGYSYGSMLAFELTKVLTSHNDTVKFLGAFNLPPHIKTRMRQLNWTNCLLHLAYFLDFMSEAEAAKLHPTLDKGPREEAIDYVLAHAPADRIKELGMDKPTLANWADLAYAMQSAAVDYEPGGRVDGIDVFVAIPLAAVAKSVEDWEVNHLAKWRDYTATMPKMWRVEGAHYTMLGPAHVRSFQGILKRALAERGL